MSRPLALLAALFLTADAEAAPLPHAAGAPAGPGPGCGGGFTAARGDTLYSIARRCETTVAELVQENGLGRPPQLAAGQRLDIPGFSRMAALTPPDVDAPLPARRPPPQRARPDRGPPPLPRVERSVYYFQRGDTLYSLARWAGTSLPALRAANPDLDPREIDPGMAILLPAGAVRPEPMRARERGAPEPMRAVAPAPPRPPATLPPRPPMIRPAPPPDDEADAPGKPAPDDEDDEDGPTPGGMDDGGPEPDGMF